MESTLYLTTDLPKFIASADSTFLPDGDNISCTVRWQGTWKLVHGCGESCRHLTFNLFTAVWRIMSPRAAGEVAI